MFEPLVPGTGIEDPGTSGSASWACRQTCWALLPLWQRPGLAGIWIGECDSRDALSEWDAPP